MKYRGEHSASRESFDLKVARFVSSRHGVLTHTDAMGLGATPSMIRHRVDEGLWCRPARGIYCIEGIPPSWRQGLLVSCLRCNGVASHRSASWLHGLAGCETDLLEVTVPGMSGVRDKRIIAHSSMDLPRNDITLVDRIPVTSVARTLIDLSGLVARNELPAERVAIAFDDAIRRRKASLKWIEQRVVALRSSGRSGVAFIDELLAARRGIRIPESVFETRALGMLEKAGFPRPVCQYEIYDGDRFVARPDFAYPEQCVAIEADGFAYHASKPDRERDYARGNALQAMGWKVLHLMWDDLARPEVFLGELDRVLRRGGLRAR